MKKNKRNRRGHVKRIIGRIFVIVLCLLLVGVFCGIGVIAWTAINLDGEADRIVMEAMRGSRTSRFYAPDDSVPRTELTLENYRPIEVDIVYGDENMVWANTEEFPETLKNAFVAIEDHRFYKHHGVDWRRTCLAAVNYIFHFRDTFGGSTITQQLIKNVHGENDISAMRKIKEILRALRIEKEYEKDEILTYYLNIVPLGHQCVGVKSAARYYFGKTLGELSVQECAALAAVTNAPARYEPIGHGEENEYRRNLVLNAMRQNGYITEEEYKRACATPLSLDVTDPVYTQKGNLWYTETVIKDVIRDLVSNLDISETAATALLYRGGLEIYTLMDADIQSAMNEYFEDVSHFPLVEGKRLNGGMIVSDPATGDLLGVIGGVGKKEGARLFNRATDGYYPPGSAIKPLSVYGPAIEEDRITYATVFEDLPIDGENGLWPHNSPNVYAGYITVHEALARSKNTVPVKILSMLGPDNVYHHLQKKLHLSGLVRGKGGRSDLALAPLALGQFSRGVTLREMAAGFGSFSNGGMYETPRSYLAVYNAKGEVMLACSRQRERVWSPETAYIMTSMMSEVVEWGTAHRITLKETVDTAGKTGTSGGDKDKWFVGYTPYYVGTARFGFDDGTSSPVGTLTHLTAWDAVMQKVHHIKLSTVGENLRGFEKPDGVIQSEYCRDSGKIPTDACRAELRGDRTEFGVFKIGTEPQNSCDRHIEGHYDMVTEMYGYGAGDADTSLGFFVLSDPLRYVPEGIHTMDEPYLIEYLIKQESGDVEEKQKM